MIDLSELVSGSVGVLVASAVVLVVLIQLVRYARR